MTKTIVTREAKPKSKQSNKAESIVAESESEAAESEAEAEVTTVAQVSMSLPPVPTRTSNSASFDKPVKFKFNKKSYMKNSIGHLWKLGETVNEVGDYVGFYNEDEQTIDFYSGGDKPETPVW